MGKKSSILNCEHNFSISFGQDMGNYSENKNNKNIIVTDRFESYITGKYTKLFCFLNLTIDVC